MKYFGDGCQTIEPVDLASMVCDKRASDNGMATQKTEYAINDLCIGKWLEW